MKQYLLFYIINIALLFLCNDFSYAQKYCLSGKIIDSKTNEAILYARISIENTNNACISDSVGNFHLLTYHKIDSVIVKAFGYDSKCIYPNWDNYNASCNIKLNKEACNQNIYYNSKTDYSLLENCIAKIRNDSIQVLVNHKLVFSTDTTDYFIDKLLFDKRKLFVVDSLDNKNIAFIECDYIAPLYNTIGKKYSLLRTEFKGLKDPLISLLAMEFQAFNINLTNISIMGKDYLSPILIENSCYYDLKIRDTIVLGTDTLLVAGIFPKSNQMKNLLNGEIILDKRKIIRNMILEPENNNTNFYFKIYIDNNSVDIKKNTLFVRIKVRDKNNKLKIIGSARSICLGKYVDTLNYLLNPAMPDSNNIEFADTFLFKKNENSKINKIDSSYSNFARKLYISPKNAIGFIDIDISKIISYNDDEGLRFGVDLHTNEKLIKRVVAGGYIAYGFKDRKIKYGGDLEFILSENPKIKAGGKYFNDIQECGTQIFSNNDYFLYDEFRNFLIMDLCKIEKEEIYSNLKLVNRLKLNLSVSHYVKIPLNDYRFGFNENNVTISTNEFEFSEISLNIESRDLSEKGNIKKSIIPSIWFQYTKGIRDFIRSDYDFNRFDIKILKKIDWNNFMSTSLQINAGYIDGDIPLTNIYNAAASYRKFTIYAPNSFACMRMNEFYSNKYISVFFTQSWFEIDLLKYSKPEFSTVFSLINGSLDEKKKHLNFDFNTLENTYCETGILINDLLKMKYYSIGFGVFYRLGFYSFDKTSDNLAFKISLKFE